MVEYTIEEAVGLLEQNHINAMANKKSLDEDIAFLRDQITTVRAMRAAAPRQSSGCLMCHVLQTEVNIARIFNHDVLKRRASEKK